MEMRKNDQGIAAQTAAQGSVLAHLLQKYPVLNEEENNWIVMEYGDIVLLSKLLAENTFPRTCLALRCNA